MISENVSRYENVVVRNHKEIGINDYGLDYLVKIEQELERYKNIIDELEKVWKEQQEHYRYYKDNRYRTFLSKNLDKLKELKGE